MPQSRQEILALATAMYGESNLNDIMAVLNKYGVESYEREVERVQLAILKLSEGNRDKLLSLIKTAKTDYRDILAWQELGPLSKEEGKKRQSAAKNLIERWGKK